MKSCLSSKNGVVKTYVWTALEILNLFMLANFFVCMIQRSSCCCRNNLDKQWLSPASVQAVLGADDIFNPQVSA